MTRACQYNYLHHTNTCDFSRSRQEQSQRLGEKKERGDESAKTLDRCVNLTHTGSASTFLSDTIDNPSPKATKHRCTLLYLLLSRQIYTFCSLSAVSTSLEHETHGTSSNYTDLRSFVESFVNSTPALAETTTVRALTASDDYITQA